MGVVGCPGGGVGGGSSDIWLACLSVRLVQMIASHQSLNSFAIGLGACYCGSSCSLSQRNMQNVWIVTILFGLKKEKFLCHPVTVVFDSSKQWQLHNSPRTAEPFARHLCACVGSAMWARVFVPNVWITAWLVTAWVIILLAAVDIDIEISFQAPPSPTPTPKTKTTPPPPPPQNLRSGIGQNKASYKLFLVPGSLPF